jgi:hypothetical protein
MMNALMFDRSLPLLAQEIWAFHATWWLLFMIYNTPLFLLCQVSSVDMTNDRSGQSGK